MAPAGTPREIVAKLNSDIVKVLKMPDTREKMAVNGLEPIVDSSAAFGAHIAAEIERVTEVVKAASLKTD